MNPKINLEQIIQEQAQNKLNHTRLEVIVCGLFVLLLAVLAFPLV